jgi:hypothetical protein
MTMARRLVTKMKLTRFLNEEIQRRLGGAEGCSIEARQIDFQPVDSNGCNWRISSWFRSSRPSGDPCEAIIKAAAATIQKQYNLKPEAI